jgi:hypothetical protein
MRRPLLPLSCSLPFRGRAGVGARGHSIFATVSTAQSPHPNPPPEGEGANTPSPR